jgi:peptidoglycan/LPS O-acetylase OafA/YrhL
MQFKNNINALRAVAVLAVVLFHFKIDGFKGGFTGVDIFFVISGFLMTGIIFSGLQENRFSLLGFYASRANRIIPALFVLCMALMIFGFIYLPIQDYRSLLRTVKSSMLFSSNFLFASEGSYFDAPVHENWLLHTWSLSLEWQFYILYPVLLMAIFRVLGEKRVRATLVLLAIASLAASIYFTKTHSVFCFYMLPTRAWELIAGGLGYLFPLRTTRRAGYALEFLGMAVIMASLSFFSEQNHWPGYLATLPVLGALLFIYGNTNSVFSRNQLPSVRWQDFIFYIPLALADRRPPLLLWAARKLGIRSPSSSSHFRLGSAFFPPRGEAQEETSGDRKSCLAVRGSDCRYRINGGNHCSSSQRSPRHPVCFP